VIATDGDDLPVALQQVRGGPGDLLHGLIDRERRDRHIPRVDHLDRGERAAVELDVMARPQMPRCLPDGHRAEPGARPVGDAAVERYAKHRDVVVGDPVDLGQPGERGGAREPGHLPPVHRPDRLADVLRHAISRF
jgi:hypothetical protein